MKNPLFFAVLMIVPLFGQKCQQVDKGPKEVVSTGYTFYWGMEKFDRISSVNGEYFEVEFPCEGRMEKIPSYAASFPRDGSSIYVAFSGDFDIHLLRYDYASGEVVPLFREESDPKHTTLSGFPGGEIVFSDGESRHFLLKGDELQPLPFRPFCIDGGYYFGKDKRGLCLYEEGGEVRTFLPEIQDFRVDFAPCLVNGRFYCSYLSEEEGEKRVNIVSIHPETKEISSSSVPESELSYWKVSQESLGKGPYHFEIREKNPYLAFQYFVYENGHYSMKDMRDPAYSVDFPASEPKEGMGYSPIAAYIPEIDSVVFEDDSFFPKGMVCVSKKEISDISPYSCSLTSPLSLLYLETSRYRFEFTITKHMDLFFAGYKPTLYRYDKETGECVNCGSGLYNRPDFRKAIRYDYVDTNGDEILYSLC